MFSLGSEQETRFQPSDAYIFLLAVSRSGLSYSGHGLLHLGLRNNPIAGGGRVVTRPAGRMNAAPTTPLLPVSDNVDLSDYQKSQLSEHP
jgi:hypothetical protein